MGIGIASSDEVCDLVSSNAVPIHCDWGSQNTPATTGGRSAAAFINLFGTWQVPGAPEWTVTSGRFDDRTAWSAGRFEVAVVGGTSVAAFEFDTVPWWKSTASTGFFAIAKPGYFLVRSASTVPEPTTGLLVGSGLFVLAAIRRTRSSGRRRSSGSSL